MITVYKDLSFFAPLWGGESGKADCNNNKRRIRGRAPQGRATDGRVSGGGGAAANRCLVNIEKGQGG